MVPVQPTAEALANSTSLVFAKDQLQYQPLPALVDRQGTVLTEWELSSEDLATLFQGGRLRLTLYYTGVSLEDPARSRPLTPMRLETVEAECNSVAVPH